jgi:hypothetical protein
MENVTPLNPSLHPLLLLVCTWCEIPYPKHLCPLPSQVTNTFVQQTLEVAAKRKYARKQEERHSFKILFQCVERCFEDFQDILENISSIMIALTAVVHCTAKNHQGIKILEALEEVQTKEIFFEHFKTYSDSFAWFNTLEIGGYTDCYGDYSSNKMAKDNFVRSELKLKRTVQALQQLEYPVGTSEMAILLTKDKPPPILGGGLFHFFTLALFNLLGMIKHDNDFRTYGAVGNSSKKFLCHALGKAEISKSQANFYMQSLLNHLPNEITLRDIENIMCKAYITDFGGCSTKKRSRDNDKDAKIKEVKKANKKQQKQTKCF